MSDCCDIWKLKFQTSPGMELEFDSEIRPVMGNGFDYDSAINKPRINGVELVGNKSNEEILIGSLSNNDIESLLKTFV